MAHGPERALRGLSGGSRVVQRVRTGAPYVLALTLAGSVVLTGETLRGWELLAFLLCCPVASLVVGYLAADTWAYNLAVVAFVIIALPLPLALRAMGVYEPDAQAGFAAPLITAASCAGIAMGHLARRWRRA